MQQEIVRFCENCKVRHDGSYASGRFCSKHCALSFSSTRNRESKNLKIAKALSRPEGYTCSKCKEWFEIYSKLAAHSKIHKRTFETLKQDGSRKTWLIRENGHQCWVCKNEKWMNRPIPLELDHIDGNPGNNDRSNLRVICPNCHAQTSTYKGKNAKHTDIDLVGREAKYAGLRKAQQARVSAAS